MVNRGPLRAAPPGSHRIESSIVLNERIQHEKGVRSDDAWVVTRCTRLFLGDARLCEVMLATATGRGCENRRLTDFVDYDTCKPSGVKALKSSLTCAWKIVTSRCPLTLWVRARTPPIPRAVPVPIPDLSGDGGRSPRPGRRYRGRPPTRSPLPKGRPAGSLSFNLNEVTAKRDSESDHDQEAAPLQWR
jgi:hypothetical protein